MANLIPEQFNRDGKKVRDYDNKLNKQQMDELVSSILRDRVEIIRFNPRQKAGTYRFKGTSKDVYFVLLNITFMGGNGINHFHPLDLKRVQITSWIKDFYDKYKDKGDVKLLGLYSYDGVNVFAEFVLDTYIQNKMNNSATHIYLNDLYQGFIGNYFTKFDKNKNKIISINQSFLAKYFDGVRQKSAIDTIDEINKNCIKWNKWILLSEAIPFEKELYDLTDGKFNNWRQNLWNGFYLESIYCRYLLNKKKPICYVEVQDDENIKKISKKYDIDLGINYDGLDFEFLADLKNDSFKGDTESEMNQDIILNDVKHVDEAVKKYKRVWFVVYLHNKQQGKTSDYEMVKWRNRYIGEIDGEERNPMSAPLTPHSIMFKEMVVVEFNEITKDKYFVAKPQFGRNSNNTERNWKYTIQKGFLRKLIKDDSLVVYRYKEE